MNTASASRSRGGMVKPSFDRRQQNVVREARPFFCHEVANFGGRQFRPKGRPKVGTLLGVAKYGIKARAIGGDQPLGLSPRSETASARAHYRPDRRTASRRKSPPGSGVLAVQRGDIG